MSYLRIQGRTGCRCARQNERETLTKAGRCFAVFHEFPPRKTIRQPYQRVIPKVLVHLGRLKGLIYSSDRFSPGRERTYVHFMETAPRLTCSSDGSQIYIIGGRYRVTRRGIEG